jgi:oxygen-independent coproporphyrinogen-3 oxidase
MKSKPPKKKRKKTPSPTEIDGKEALWKIPTPITGECSLYFHIPFCERKCPYCHFYSQTNTKSIKDFVSALLQEWNIQKHKVLDKKIVSIYFGGGTPSLLGPKYIETILSTLSKDIPLDPDVEITLESNPHLVSFFDFVSFQKAGINRVSLGVQSLNEKELLFLQRLHTPKQALEAIETIQKASIHNISIDLMYDIPHQTLASWKETLSLLPKESISHVSLYNLTFEPKTPFFRQKEFLQKQVPSEKISLKILKEALSFLASSGFQRYEIASFAKKDLYSRHNIGYWTERPFIGFGPSAWSYFNQERYSNISSLNAYIDKLSRNELPIDFTESLKYPNNILELLILHLRILQGFSLTSFTKRHGDLPLETNEVLEKLQKEKLLTQKKDILSLTKKGSLFYDHIAVELLA